jgi:hypothetical protein
VLVLHRVAELEHVEDQVPAVLRMRPLHEQVVQRIPGQLDRLVRKGDGPAVFRLLRLAAHVEEDEAIGHVVGIAIVVALGIGDRGLVEQIDDPVAPPAREPARGDALVMVAAMAALLRPVEAKAGAELPVRLEILRELAIDRAHGPVHIGTRQRARPVQDGNQHVGPP